MGGMERNFLGELSNYKAPWKAKGTVNLFKSHLVRKICEQSYLSTENP